MSKGSESIKELRKICQESRYENEGGMPWFERNFYRRFSIYFTKIFLKIGISANQATLLSLISALFGGLFLIFANIITYWIISTLFLIFCLVLDRVDGETARYTKTTSKFGKHFDFMVGTFMHAYILICMTFGAYLALHIIVIFAFGFLAVILNLLEVISSLNIIYKIPYTEGELPNISEDVSNKKSFVGRYIYGSVRRISNFLGPGALIYPILMVMALDIYFAPVSLTIPIIGMFAVNTRYAFLIFYSFGKIGSFIVKTHRLIHQ